MGYRSLEEALLDLEKDGQLLRIKEEIDPYLEMAEIHRRVFDAKGPAILFEKVKGSPFRAASNVYGTFERTEFLFRKELDKVGKVINVKADPTKLLQSPLSYRSVPFTALNGLPKKSRSAAVIYSTTTIDQLPQIVSWPMDGGAFVTLPQVMTLPPGSEKIMESNVGMYRIQLSGNAYIQNQEVGLHYQLHRGIGVHHTQYNNSEKKFRCVVAIGGPPSNAFAAIMPLPEGLSELSFAGLLNGRRFRYHLENGAIISNDADFCIVGTIVKNKKKLEGPFGDHLGYYSLAHDFPIMEVEKVYHRKEAIWHFTVVGRPPQEDSSFGHLIHKLVKPLTPSEFPGLVSINAVDASGVHPLLLAIGKERYMPFREKVPEEILTIANHILGKGQTSLAKYLLIASDEDNPELDTKDIAHFFHHFLERVNWERDLHFQTKTTIDTLDYSGSGWNAGSKVVMACRGSAKRKLATSIPEGINLNIDWDKVNLILPGILGIGGKPFSNEKAAQEEISILSQSLKKMPLGQIPLIVLCDDPLFLSTTLNNFLWVTFTRSNPSHDIYGVDEKLEYKHWGCAGSLIIDARIKPHHAPELVKDENVNRRVDALLNRYPI